MTNISLFSVCAQGFSVKEKLMLSVAPMTLSPHKMYFKRISHCCTKKEKDLTSNKCVDAIREILTVKHYTLLQNNK